VARDGSPGSVPVPRRGRWLAALLAAGLVVVAAGLTLGGPPIDPAWATRNCFSVLPLPRGFELLFGCDGVTFLRGAVEPSLLLEPRFAPPTDFTYQSRPLHIGAAAVLGRLLQPVVAPAVPAEARYQGRAPLRRYAGAYAAYVLLNGALLIAAGLALHDALLGARPAGAREALALLAGLAGVIVTAMVRLWLFTPHTILWGTVVSLWAVAVGRRVLAQPSGGAATTLRAAAAAGLAALAYGFAVLVPAVAVVALASRAWTDGAPGGRGRGPRRVAPVALGAAAVFALPTLAWIAVSYAVSGGYYHHEAVAYRQFRWLPDALAAGWLATYQAVAARAGVWLRLLATEWLAPAACVAMLAAAAAVVGGSRRRVAETQRPLLEAAALTLVLGLGFWYLNGELGAGRAAVLAPVPQVVAAMLALDLDRRAGGARWSGLLLAVALAWGAWQMLRPLA